MLGAAIGLYHGSLSYGVIVDLFVARLSLTTFTYEYGESPGVDPRPTYAFSLSVGVDF